jgi:hypothetical protein
MFAHAISSTNAVTPSRRFIGAVASRRTLLWPCPPGCITIGFDRNRASVCSLMPFCSGASTSLMIAWYCVLSAALACSIVTPGSRRANKYAQ